MYSSMLSDLQLLELSQKQPNNLLIQVFFNNI